MKTLHFSIIIVTVLCVSLLPSVHGQAVGSQVSPFDFQLDESAVDGKRYSYVITGGNPAAIIKQNETKSLPVIILPATDKPIPIKFHLSVGYDQTGPIRMPLGVHAIVEPSEITVKPHQNETINIVVSVDKNAPSGKYQLNIVGEWPGPNGFLGSSVIINVGKDYGPDAMPFNAMWTPLKRYQSGVAIKDISCNQDLQLVIKAEDGSPACVKFDSVDKLIKRGWAKQTIHIQQNNSSAVNFETMPDDFRIDYSLGVDEKNVFDTQKHQYINMTCTPPVEFTLTTSKYDLQQVWQSAKDNSFFDLDNFTLACLPTENCMKTTPITITTITITANENTHSVTHNSSYRFPEDPNLARFENVTKSIQDVLADQGGIRNLPNPSCTP